MLRIPRAEVHRIAAHAEAAFPEEACGFLLGTATPDGARKECALALPGENEKQEERERRYVIAPRQLLRAEEQAMERGLDVIGIYHSHPSGVARPSAFDLAHAWPWYSYVVAAVTAGKAGEVTSWRMRDDRSAFGSEEMVQVPPQGMEP